MVAMGTCTGKRDRNRCAGRCRESMPAEMQLFEFTVPGEPACNAQVAGTAGGTTGEGDDLNFGLWYSSRGKRSVLISGDRREAVGNNLHRVKVSRHSARIASPR